MFIIVSGSSGCGKNTIINELLKTRTNLKLLPTLTTREKREGETDGNPFYFVTKDEFQHKIKNNELLEHELIHNNFYGASKLLLDNLIAEGKMLIKDIGVKGTFNLEEKLINVTPIIKIFFTVNNKKTLVKRLKGRKEKEIKLRLSRYKFEQKQKNGYDYIIKNEDMQKTIELMDVILDNANNYKNILPTKSAKKINTRKVKKYIDKFLSKHRVKPVKVCKYEDDIYLLNGHERFIASILTNKTLTKVFVDKKPMKLSKEDNENFKKILQTKI